MNNNFFEGNSIKIHLLAVRGLPAVFHQIEHNLIQHLLK